MIKSQFKIFYIFNTTICKSIYGKFRSKKYTRYTGYPGGFKKETPEDVITKKGYTELFRRAVYGMLPTNKLRARLIKNLEVIE